MKTLKSIFAALVIVSFASVSVSAQNTANANASAVIQTPLTITHQQHLHFGFIAPASEGGNNIVSVNTSGDRSIGGAGNGQLITGSQAPQAASFSLSGFESNAYNIVINEIASISNGTESMVISNWGARANNESADGTTGILTNGTGSISVGADITVSQSQANGTYTGEFSVTVAYQ